MFQVYTLTRTFEKWVSIKQLYFISIQYNILLILLITDNERFTLTFLINY